MTEPVNNRKGYMILAGFVAAILLLFVGAFVYDEMNLPGGSSARSIGTGIAGIAIFLIVALLMLAIYFVPTIVAIWGKHHNAGPIILINLFFGWSLIGWVVALAWAMSSPAPRPVYYVQQPPPQQPPASHDPQYNYQRYRQ